MAKSNYINLRVSDEELIKLNEISNKFNMSKSDVLRNLIMTSDSKEPLSIELLQRIHVVLQMLIEIMKVLVPGKISQEWIDKIVEKSKKRYPME